MHQKRLPDELKTIVTALRSCPDAITGVALESTYNWYWLVDGLQAAGLAGHLADTAAVKQYDGLKHSGDFSDARTVNSRRESNGKKTGEGNTKCGNK